MVAERGTGRERTKGLSPLGTTGFVYDELNRLVQTNLPGGANVGANYDLNGNAIQARKEDGTLVLTQYDALNRPKSVTQPTGTTNLVTSFGYNLRGERTSVTNPRNLTTTYGFDERGMAKGVTYPDGTTRQVAFDGAGAKRWAINGRGQKTVLNYDTLGRMTGIDYPASADVTYGYSLEGRRSSMVDATGTTTYTYDTAGRPKTQTQGLTGKTLTTAYVAGTDRRLSLSDGAQTWTTGYDAGLRPATLSQTVGGASPVAATAYYPSGAVQTQTFGNATKTTYGLDARGRTTSIAHATTGGVAQQTLTYHYGADGNPDSYADAAAGVGTWTTSYVHDKADRLTSESRTGGPSGNYTSAYAYDGQGNRLSVTRNGSTLAYGAAGANDQFSTGEGYAFSSYDSDGNPGAVSGPGLSMSLSYDEAGRVTSVSGTGGGSFRYDGDGRRVERTAAGVTTRFVYDGDTAVEETSGSNTVTLYRTPGVGFVRSGAQRYEQDGALGSLLTARDASGAAVGQTEYDAYGKEAWTGASADRGSYRFAGAKGYANDDATGMQMLGARYYLPALGRFLTQDPIGHEGGLNLYAYCGDSPLLKVDPKGTYEVWLAWHHVALDAFHSFVMVRDNVKGSSTYGWTWGFSAGPTNYGAGSLLDAGPIVDHSGLYTRNHYDNPYFWQIGKTQLDSNGLAAAPLLNYLSRMRGEMMAIRPQYKLLDGPNSNTFATWILDLIGIHEENDRARSRGNWAVGQLQSQAQGHKGWAFPGWGWPRN